MSCGDPQDRDENRQRHEEIRERVRRHYAEALGAASGCCGSGNCCGPAAEGVFVNRKCPQCDPRKGPHPSPPCLMDAA